MIHSLSGGTIKDIGFSSFAKVKLATGETMFFVYDFPLNVGEEVLVPVGRSGTPTQATVVELRPNVSNRLAPFPIKSMKNVIKKIEK